MIAGPLEARNSNLDSDQRIAYYAFEGAVWPVSIHDHGAEVYNTLCTENMAKFSKSSAADVLFISKRKRQNDLLVSWSSLVTWFSNFKIHMLVLLSSLCIPNILKALQVHSGPHFLTCGYY